ncbi:MAG TPA: alkaline phosphatase family protein [Gaiellaceae bacterium]|jgi:phospholipase C
MPAVRKKPSPRGQVAVAADDTLANLDKVEHVVVLMLENRSFDHMLGYLTLVEGRTEVDGLTSGMANTYKGKRYPVHHLQRTAFTKAEDPCHGGACVAEQVSNDMGGFVSNFATSRKNAKNLGVVMGYYTGADLPTYDHLAREFCVCDRWFSSVPGATWPNRLYAVAGHAAGSKDPKKVPIYDEASFMRQLDARGVSWRWYTHDVATLRFSDGRYLIGHDSHFAYFDRRSILAPRNFLDDAREGKLPSVCWIDPNFIDVSFIGPAGSNDDHPPSDVHAGQELVLKVYTALLKSPQWSKTMLVITYDEHGGFYDHVLPPPARDDKPAFRTYGVRVPTIVVSPFTPRGGVSNVLYDHTSIIKTVLLRFCKDANGQIPDMGKRVQFANHLGATLTLAKARKPTNPAAYEYVVDRITSWRAAVFRSRMLMEPLTTPADPLELNDLQQQVLAAKKVARAKGLPEGQP